MTSKSAALVLGFIFLAVGLLGYVNNPIIGESEDVIFHSDNVHNMVHIISGALFVLIALASPSFARTFMIIFGIVYLAIGIMGLVNMEAGQDLGEVLGFLHVNTNVNYLHIGLGIVILLAALASASAKRVVTR
jgi:hypothetical protein